MSELETNVSRGDVCFSVEHDILVIDLGEGRALFIKADGTLVDRDTPSPIAASDGVHVIRDPRALLADLVAIVRHACTTDGRPKSV